MDSVILPKSRSHQCAAGVGVWPTESRFPRWYCQDEWERAFLDRSWPLCIMPLRLLVGPRGYSRVRSHSYCASEHTYCATLCKVIAPMRYPLIEEGEDAPTRLSPHSDHVYAGVGEQILSLRFDVRIGQRISSITAQ